MATQLENKWPVLGIDLVTVAVSFFLAYLIRFNFSLNFDLSKWAIQLPGIVLIALMVLLITGSYKREFWQISVRGVRKILKAISLLSVIVFLLVVINMQMGIFPEFSIPLSIVILFSLLSFSGLIASRYIFMGVIALVKKNQK
jgi:FlaA1/EpsC-like NDP-sugar epimerase